MEQKIIRERYKVVEEIARGGMGVVYLARDLLTNQKVALKTSSWSGEAKLREGFEIEAKLLARLDHPGLPKVRDYFLFDGSSQALVMDFVEGETLSELLESARRRDGRALNVRLVFDWSLQILGILSYLHGFSPPVVHRDIKPNNIKLKPDGKIVLLDFGLAKGTSVSVVSGGSNYSSLEQLNLSATDPRSDLYAFGATLYHLLTDCCPPGALDRFREVCAAQPNAAGDWAAQTRSPNAAPTVSELNPRVPPEISEIVAKAMLLFPEQRFQTAAEMKLALQTAKRDADGKWTEFEIQNRGAATAVNLPANFGAAHSLFDDEENFQAPTLDKTAILGTNPTAVINPTQFVSTSRAPTANNDRDDRAANGDDYTTFEIARLPERPNAPKIGKKIVPLLLGVLALAGLSLAGLGAWYFFAPTEKANKRDAAQDEKRADAALNSGATVENPLKVSTYVISGNGDENKIDENHLFADEEQFRFRVKPAADGFLYVISRNNRDELLLAYPKPNQTDNAIKKNSESRFPRDDGKFRFNKDSPSEMRAYFVVVASREDDLAKRIRTTLGGGQEKNLAAPEVSRLMKDLDEIAAEATKPPANGAAAATRGGSVEIVKLQKKTTN